MTCPSVEVSRDAVMTRKINMYIQYIKPQKVKMMKN